MEYTATCRICGSEIPCLDENLCTLGEHFLKKHPELELIHYQMESKEDFKNKKTKPKKTSRKFSLSNSMNKLSSSYHKINKKIGTSRSLYKTTVESWRPGSNPLSCPKCGNTQQPYIRRQRNKIAYNSLGAFFLLGCWPLCFLPMLMSGGGTSTIICCRMCGYCFGTYDKKKGKLIPPTKEIKIETPTDIC